MMNYISLHQGKIQRQKCHIPMDMSQMLWLILGQGMPYNTKGSVRPSFNDKENSLKIKYSNKTFITYKSKFTKILLEVNNV